MQRAGQGPSHRRPASTKQGPRRGPRADTEPGGLPGSFAGRHGGKVGPRVSVGGGPTDGSVPLGRRGWTHPAWLGLGGEQVLGATRVRRTHRRLVGHVTQPQGFSPSPAVLPAEVSGQEPPAVTAPLSLPPLQPLSVVIIATPSVIGRPQTAAGSETPLPQGHPWHAGPPGVEQGIEPGPSRSPPASAPRPVEGAPPPSFPAPPPRAVPLRQRRGEGAGWCCDGSSRLLPPPPLPPCAPAGWRGPSCRARHPRARRAPGAPPPPGPQPLRSRTGSARCCRPVAGAPWAATWARGRGAGRGPRAPPQPPLGGAFASLALSSRTRSAGLHVACSLGNGRGRWAEFPLDPPLQLPEPPVRLQPAWGTLWVSLSPALRG